MIKDRFRIDTQMILCEITVNNHQHDFTWEATSSNIQDEMASSAAPTAEFIQSTGNQQILETTQESDQQSMDESLSNASFSTFNLMSPVRTTKGEVTLEVQPETDHNLISVTTTHSQSDMPVIWTTSHPVDLMTTISSGYSSSTQVVTTIQEPMLSSVSTSSSTGFMQTISGQTMSRGDIASPVATLNDPASVVTNGDGILSGSDRVFSINIQTEAQITSESIENSDYGNSVFIVSSDGDSTFRETGSSNSINFGKTLTTSISVPTITDEPSIVLPSMTQVECQNLFLPSYWKRSIPHRLQ